MATTYAASEKQLALITRLLGEKDLTGTPFEGHTVAPAGLTGGYHGSASAAIDALFAMPRKAQAAAASTSTAPAPEGMHVLDGKTFKVQQAKNGSGNLYAKELRQDDYDGKWFFEYAPGAIRNLSDATRMSAEQASQFGALYGICCNCGRALTDEGSIHYGYGPVCAANNGWPHGKVAAPAPVNPDSVGAGYPEEG